MALRDPSTSRAHQQAQRNETDGHETQASVAAIAAGTQAPAVEMASAAAPLVVSEARTLVREGGRNPTVASDRRSGTVYLAWAQEVPATGQKDQDGKKADPGRGG